MKMYYRNSSSSFSNVLFIPSNNREDELERVLTKRESKEFPSLLRVKVKRRRDYVENETGVLNLNELEEESVENKASDSEARIKYKTVWMGPGGGYSVMEEYVDARKCLEKEVPIESEMEFRRCRRPGECKDTKRMSNIQNDSGVTILENADTLREDSYIYRTSVSQINVKNKELRKVNSVGPLPYQNRVSIGNRSRLGRDLVPLN